MSRSRSRPGRARVGPSEKEDHHRGPLLARKAAVVAVAVSMSK